MGQQGIYKVTYFGATRIYKLDMLSLGFISSIVMGQQRIYKLDCNGASRDL